MLHARGVRAALHTSDSEPKRDLSGYQKINRMHHSAHEPRQTRPCGVAPAVGSDSGAKETKETKETCRVTKRDLSNQSMPCSAPAVGRRARMRTRAACSGWHTLSDATCENDLPARACMALDTKPAAVRRRSFVMRISAAQHSAPERSCLQSTLSAPGR